MQPTADVSAIESEVRRELDSKYAARELAIKLGRPIVQDSSKAIRALHRNEPQVARDLMDEARTLIEEVHAGVEGHEDIARSGLFYDAEHCATPLIG